MSDRLRSALSLLGLGVKAGRVAIGVDAARAALQKGKAEMIVLSNDAGDRANEKLVMLAGHKKIPVFYGPDAERLGAALGRPPVHGVAVLDRQLARGLRTYLAAVAAGESHAG